MAEEKKTQNILYILGDKENPNVSKIGITDDMDKRLKSFKSYSSSVNKEFTLYVHKKYELMEAYPPMDSREIEEQEQIGTILYEKKSTHPVLAKRYEDRVKDYFKSKRSAHGKTEWFNVSPEELDTFVKPLVESIDVHGRFFWSDEGLSTKETAERLDLLAFMAMQGEGFVLNGSRALSSAPPPLYPYYNPIKEWKSFTGNSGSYKDDLVLNPLYLHKNLKEQTSNTLFDYCVSKYLESEDPLYFSLYYLSRGDVLLKDLGKMELDEVAKNWVFKQFTIAQEVEKDLLYELVKRKGLSSLSMKSWNDWSYYDVFPVFHDILVTKYNCLLPNFEEVSRGLFLASWNYRIGVFSYFFSRWSQLAEVD